MSGSRWVRVAIVAIFAGLLTLVGTSAMTAQTPPLLNGRCHEYKCSCFRFQGVGNSCSRSGCGHHWDNHY